MKATFEQANNQACDLIAMINNPSSFSCLKGHLPGLGDEIDLAIATAVNAGNEELDQSYNRGVLATMLFYKVITKDQIQSRLHKYNSDNRDPNDMGDRG